MTGFKEIVACVNAKFTLQDEIDQAIPVYEGWESDSTNNFLNAGITVVLSGIFTQAGDRVHITTPTIGWINVSSIPLPTYPAHQYNPLPLLLEKLNYRGEVRYIKQALANEPISQFFSDFNLRHPVYTLPTGYKLALTGLLSDSPPSRTRAQVILPNRHSAG